MESLDKFFKFKVGDIVQHRISFKQKKVLLLIVERALHECDSGMDGVQKFYICRVVIASTEEGKHHIEMQTSNYVRFNEIELECINMKKEEDIL